MNACIKLDISWVHKKTSDPYATSSLQDKQAKNARVPHPLINYTVQCLYKTGL